MKLKIDLKIIIFLIIFWMTKQIKIYAIIMLFCFLHEIGHIITAKILKIRIKKLEILPCGFSSEFIIDKGIKIKNYEFKILIVSLGGPVTSLLLAILSECGCIRIPGISQPDVIYSNILILLFNLLPLYPLDGGRIIKGILNIKLGEIKADEIMNNVSTTTIIALTIISSIAVYYFKNIAIFLVCIFLWQKVLIFCGENSKI